MKMRRNKFVPINSKLNSLKKTKVQFSTRLSGCLGDHQCQEFFDRVNITRQSGICSKNKNNSFGDKRSNSFRQTLQLNVPFVADFSDSKLFCICYPVHFFRKKLHSYDSEDNRFASVRVYYPASRMKNGNDFKVSLDYKKRFHLCPYQYEFVGYSDLLTLSLEDLSLAVFRAKSSSEKFKIVTSFAIPKLLISSTVSNSQTGTPIFIATERIYSRILKLIACSQSDAFKLNNTSAINSESNSHLRKCILKWIGLEDFLPSSSRIIFVRRVSSDSGETLGASILNSPGPKIRRSRVKDHDRFSIRLKQIKLEHLEECDEDSKDEIYSDEPLEQNNKITNCDHQDNKRPRGRPKKLLDTTNLQFLCTDIINTDETLSPKKDEVDKPIVDKVKCVSMQLKSESTSNSMTDSTSEEKYSVYLSSCTTPDTNKSCSPVILNDTITTSNNSNPSILQPLNQMADSNIIKNKRGRPRKYPLSLNVDDKITKGLCDNMDNPSQCHDSENGSFKNRKRSNSNAFTETDAKVYRSSNSSISSNDGIISKIRTPGFETSITVNDSISYVNQSIWRPLKHALPAPDPIVPFIKLFSNTGLGTARKLKRSSNYIYNQSDVFTKEVSPERSFHDYNAQKFLNDITLDNLNKSILSQSQMKPSPNLLSNNYMSLPGHSSAKSMLKDMGFNSSSNNQYLLPNNNGFNPLLLPQNMSSMSYGTGLLSPLINNIFSSNGSSFVGCQSPIINTIASLFSPINTPNPMKIQSLPISPPFYDNSCRQMFPNSHFLPNDNHISSNISHNSQQSLQHQQYNQILLANKYDSLYPNLSSWNNDYHWKY